MKNNENNKEKTYLQMQIFIWDCETPLSFNTGQSCSTKAYRSTCGYKYWNNNNPVGKQAGAGLLKLSFFF